MYCPQLKKKVTAAEVEEVEAAEVPTEMLKNREAKAVAEAVAEEVAGAGAKRVEVAKMILVELWVAELVEDHTGNCRIPGPLP